MSNHRADTRPARSRRRSGRARAILSLGAVAVLATGMSVKGTFAFWTDTATVNTGNFVSGTLDVTLAGGLIGTGGETKIDALNMAGMAPGESVAASFAIANNGSVGLTYGISSAVTGELAQYMQFSIYAGATSAVTNPVGTNGIRTGSCSGTPILTDVVLSGSAVTPAPLTAFPRRTLPATGTKTENICVVAKLNPGADNGAQSKTMSASLVFDAKQVNAV